MSPTRPIISSLWRLALLPLLVYAALLLLYQWPALSQFSTHFFCDTGDGLHGIWNVWWVNFSATTLHQSPYHTTYLHYPQGVTLVTQTMAPLNGYIAIVLLRLFTQVQTFNVLVILSFLISALSAYWLALALTRSIPGALFAGVIYSFSGYHFAHAQGHLQLISMHFMPLFLLLFWRLLQNPKWTTALAAALVLYLVRLCDLYYLVFCIMAAGVMLLYEMRLHRDWKLPFRRPLAPKLALFAIASALTAGIIILRIFLAHSTDPFGVTHSPYRYSMDFLSPIIPGWSSHWAPWTGFYWHRLEAEPVETSIYMGWVALGLMIFAWLRRRHIPNRDFRAWYLLFWVFFIFALGPRLLFFGVKIPSVLPYLALHYLPGFKLSGMPVRFFVISLIAASVAAAYGIKLLLQSPGQRCKYIVAALAVLMVIEYWPMPIPTTPSDVPPYVLALRSLPPGAVIDRVAPPTFALRYQTIHEHPMAFGYITREPASTVAQRQAIEAEAASADYTALSRRGFVYLVLPAPHPDPRLILLQQYPDAALYRIQATPAGP